MTFLTFFFLQRPIAISGYINRLTDLQVNLHLVARIPGRSHGVGCHPCSQVSSSVCDSWIFLMSSSFDLPDDVFQPGETRASRPKKKVTKRSETAGQKRSIGELDVSVSKRVRSA